MIYVGWIATALSIAGLILNTRKLSLCWPVWLVSNGLWIVVGIDSAVWSLVATQAVFFFANIYGFFHWKESSQNHAAELAAQTESTMNQTLPTLRGAVISDDQRYRYILSRTWEQGKPRLLFCMLNPSTADAHDDDPTIRRCIGFARREGYGGITVVNLFGLRATDPAEIHSWKDPVGPENDTWLRIVLNTHDKVVLAWGAYTHASRRVRVVLKMINSAKKAAPHVLGLTKDGFPRHPLYLSADAPLVPFLIQESMIDG